MSALQAEARASRTNWPGSFTFWHKKKRGGSMRSGKTSRGCRRGRTY
jgi:hypothetical protein